MRSFSLLLVLLASSHAVAQLFPYAGQYVTGTVLLPDSSVRSGEVMWVAHQNQKLRFRTSAEVEPEKYGPAELISFVADTFHFVSLHDIRVWAENTAVLGKTSRIKHVFAQRLHAGTYTVHMVFIEAYDGVSGAIQTYPNILFQRSDEPGATPVPLPFGIRMKDERLEKAKEPLYALFTDHPALVDALRALGKQDDIAPVIRAVKAIDAR
jgi:hypothetical protein